MFYIRLGERQENTIGRTPSKPPFIKGKVLLAFSQSYVKYNLKKNKIVVASTIGFFGH
jgi:hypothetical protein